MTVSVVTPMYNAAEVIGRCVQSVAQQTYSPCEHVIVDDGSVDGSIEIVERLSIRYPAIRLIRQENQGAGAARNAGIACARGRYIAFLDADDCWDFEKLESQITFMKEEDIAFSYGDYFAIDAVTRETAGICTAPSCLRYHDLLRRCSIGCLTAAYDTESLGKVYMPPVRRGQDWGLWLRLTRKGGAAHRYPGCHAYYSTGGKSLSGAKVRKAADVYSIYRHYEGIGRVYAFRLMCEHIVSSVIRRPKAF